MDKHSSTSAKSHIKVHDRNRVARILTTDELNRISIAVLDSRRDIDLAIHELLALGFRASEVAGARHGVGNTVILAVPKNLPHRGGLCPVQPIVLRSAEFSNAIPGELLFPCRAGRGPLDIVRIARIFHRWVIRAGLSNQGVTLLSFRRSVSAHKLINAASSLPGNM
jgi:integrase